MSNLPISPCGVIGVGTSFALAGLFYKLHQNKTKELRKLKEIPIFKPDQHLLELLKASPRKRFQYVAVVGLVQADGDPLTSEFDHESKGVVQKISEVEHWEYWNSLTETWDSRRSNLKQTNNMVPFGLVEEGYATPGAIYVKVQNPLKATGLDLEQVHYRMRRVAREGLKVSVLQALSGERAVAKEESEEMLRVGATVTGIGELVLEAETEEGGLMRLEAPKDGRPYILVPTDYKSYVARHENSAFLWKMLAVACVAVGTTVLAGTVNGFLNK